MKKPAPVIAAATGHASSSRSRGGPIEAAMSQAVLAAHAEGITDPSVIHERMMSARQAVKATLGRGSSATGVGRVELSDAKLEEFNRREKANRKAAAGFKTANDSKVSKTAIAHDRWRACADDVRKDHPEIRDNDSAVGRLVIQRLKLNRSVDCVRKAISQEER
jgi:hypothetical protein